MLEATPGVVRQYVEKGHNVMLVGDHGTGKTSMVREVAKKLGWRMLEFNAALMEPYVDLIGIPMSRASEDGTEELRMVAKREIFEADLIFIDEFNRGQPATINALMNVINDHQINGQPLPKLKAVVAACNPPKSSVTGSTYMVGELDPAQVDRFTIQLSMGNKVNAKYLTDALGMPNLAHALAKWHRSLDFGGTGKVNRVPYVSPRRVERMGRVFAEFPQRNTLMHVLGADAEKFPVGVMYRDFYAAYREDIAGSTTKGGKAPVKARGKKQAAKPKPRATAGVKTRQVKKQRSALEDVSAKILGGRVPPEDAFTAMLGAL